MTTGTTTRPARLGDHLRIPLFRNGYALVANAVTTSAIGVAYWVIAARRYSADDVGVNSAMIAALIFLANLSQLNLMNALNRFVPRAGAGTRKLIVASYAVAGSVSIVVGVIFIAGLGWWAPGLNDLRSNPLLGGLFVTGIGLWSLFVLQDAVLTGLRKAVWVPVSNLAFAAVKILLLIGLASSFPRFGVFASWVLPLAALIVVVNVFIFSRLLPAHVAETTEEPTALGRVARYAAGDYSASLIWTATTQLMPLVVLERAGAAQSAYFYLAWTITYSLYLVSRNMGQSLITEGALDPQRLSNYARATVVQNLRLVVPAVVGVVALAPLILGLFGMDYAAEATTLLRLLALSAIPNAVTALFISLARVEQKVGAIVAVFGALAVIVLPLGIVLLDSIGITGIGVAWLVAQTIVAAALLATRLRMLWDGGPVGRIADRFIGPVARRLGTLITGSGRRTVTKYLPEILAVLDGAEPTTVGRVTRTLHGTSIAEINADDGPLLLRLSETASANLAITNQHAMLGAVHDIADLSQISGLVPKPLTVGEVDGLRFAVETRLPGVNAATVGGARMWIPAAAARAIDPLHRQTGVVRTATPADIERWVEEPVRTLRASSNQSLDALTDLAQELGDRIRGRRVFVSMVHGDYWAGNLLVDVASRTVTGIIDWDNAEPGALAVLDGAHFWASWTSHESGLSLGEVLAGGIGHPPTFGPTGPPTFDSHGGDDLETDAVLQLVWLRHTASNLRKSERYRSSNRWWESQVLAVVRRYGS